MVQMPILEQKIGPWYRVEPQNNLFGVVLKLGRVCVMIKHKHSPLYLIHLREESTKRISLSEFQW